MNDFSNQLLNKVNKSHIVNDPFPHIIIKEPISNELANKLLEEYPSNVTIANSKPIGSNQRFSYCAKDALIDPNISEQWKGFVKHQVSGEFSKTLITLFAEKIQSLYPQLELKNHEDFSTGIWGIEEDKNADFLLDVKICINSPVLGNPDAVRVAHVDSPNKLFAGLYYLKHPEDQSEGGDLELYRFKNGQRSFSGPYADPSSYELVKKIPYEHNTLVIMLNSPDSIHGVSIRSKTPYTRSFVNITVDVPEPLFNLESYQKS